MNPNSPPNLQSAGSTTAAFVSYDENLEPIATENEAAEYGEEVGQEKEEEQMLLSRISEKLISGNSMYHFVLASFVFYHFVHRLFGCSYFDILILKGLDICSVQLDTDHAQ